MNDYADDIAATLGLPPGHIPYVDPDVGGQDARMLVLLDNPSSKAEAGTGSGLLSLDNNDPTAANCRDAYERHGISWSDVVHWNVVPFPVADTNASSSAGERQAAVPFTRGFVALLPRVEIVLRLGVNARDGWDRARIRRNGLWVVPGRIPHCSRQGLADPTRRATFEHAMQRVSEELQFHQ